MVRDKARAKVFVERAYTVRKVLIGDNNLIIIKFKYLTKQPIDYYLYSKRMKYYNNS
jgi:hypothetical protein